MQEKRMARRVFLTLLSHEKFSGKIPTVQEVQQDMEDGGLGKPSLTRLRDALRKDRRTVKVKPDQWRVKMAEIGEETLALYNSSQPAQALKKMATNVHSLAGHNFHPMVEAVSASQFASGHYKEAIQNAFVEVIHEVKTRCGNPRDSQGNELDGDKLMQRVFGCDGEQQPIIALNSLKSSLDRAEQRGIMYLYKGVVGIRDRKAHLNFLQRDHIKALEYLSLASLLMRLLDENSSTQ